MQKWVCRFLLIAAGTLWCLVGWGQNTNAPLAFFIVSEKKIEGGKYIDLPHLPKVGWISAKPDLVLTNVVEVHRTEGDRTMPFDADTGGYRAPPALTVVLRTEDGRRFTALTRKALDKRLLITLSGWPLVAPMVRAPIEGNRLSFSAEESELRKAEDALKKLVPAG